MSDSEIINSYDTLLRSSSYVNSRINAAAARISAQLKELDEISDTSYVNQGQLSVINDSFDTLQTSEHEDILNELIKWIKATKVNFDEFDFNYFNQIESFQKFYTASLVTKVDGLEHQIGTFDGYLDQMKDKIDFFHNKMSEFFSMLPTDGPGGSLHFQYFPGKGGPRQNGNDKEKIKFYEAQIRAFSDALKRLQHLLQSASHEIKKLRDCEAEIKKQLDDLKKDFEKLQQANQSQDALIKKLNADKEKEELDRLNRMHFQFCTCPSLVIPMDVKALNQGATEAKSATVKDNKNDEDDENVSKKKKKKSKSNENGDDDEYENENEQSSKPHKEGDVKQHFVYLNRELFDVDEDDQNQGKRNQNQNQSNQDPSTNSQENDGNYQKLLNQLDALKKENESLQNNQNGDEDWKKKFEELLQENEKLKQELVQAEEKNRQYQTQTEQRNSHLPFLVEDGVASNNLVVFEINDLHEEMKDRIIIDPNSLLCVDDTWFFSSQITQTDLSKADLLTATSKRNPSSNAKSNDSNKSGLNNQNDSELGEYNSQNNNSKFGNNQSNSKFGNNNNGLNNLNDDGLPLVQRLEPPELIYKSTQANIEPFTLNIDNKIVFEIKDSAGKKSEYLSNDDNFIAIRTPQHSSKASSLGNDFDDQNLNSNFLFRNVRDCTGNCEEDYDEEGEIYPPFHVKVQYTPTTKKFKRLWIPKPPQTMMKERASPRFKTPDRKAGSVRANYLTPDVQKMNELLSLTPGRRSQMLGSPPFAEMAKELRPRYPLLVVQSLNSPHFGGYRIDTNQVTAFPQRYANTTATLLSPRLQSLRKMRKEMEQKEEINENQDENEEIHNES